MEQYTIRLEAADAAAVEQEAAAKKISVADVIRAAVREHVAVEEVPRVLPLIELVLNKHLGSLRGLVVKSFVAASIAAWETRWLVEHVGEYDPEEIWALAHGRALVDLRSKGTSEWDDGHEQYDATDAAVYAELAAAAPAPEKSAEGAAKK